MRRLLTGTSPFSRTQSPVLLMGFLFLFATVTSTHAMSSLPARPASYGQASESAVYADSHHLLSLEADEVGASLRDENQFEAPRSWWGADRPAYAKKATVETASHGPSKQTQRVEQASGGGSDRSDMTASGAELKRMGNLMRRQLQPQAFILSYEFYVPTTAPGPAPTGPSMPPTLSPTGPSSSPTLSPTGPSSSPTSQGPSMLPTPLPTPVPTDMPLPTGGFPTPAPSSSPAPTVTPAPITPTSAPTMTPAPTMSPAPTSTFKPTADTPPPTMTPAPTVTPAPSVTFDPTMQPTTFTPAPTTFDATQVTFLTSQITVSGIDDEDFADDGILVVQFALNDVIQFMESPDEVIDATVTIDDNGAGARRRRLQQAGDVTATIEYIVRLDTAATKGFTSTDEALESMENDVIDAAESGYLAQRINYWANYFGSDFNPEIDPEQNPDGFWNFAPSPAPTPFSPMPSMAPTTAAPTISPQPTVSPAPTAAPTITPAPSVTPAPQMALPPIIPGAPTPAPQTVALVPTEAPVAAGRDSKKKKNNNNQSTIIIAVVVALLVLLCLLCICGYFYMKSRERKLTERKDSWDISTMFNDEADLPEAEEMIDVEPEPGADEADVSGAALIEGPPPETQLAVSEDQQPQALQKITQAAEL